MINVLGSKMKKGLNGRNFKDFQNFFMILPKLQLEIMLTLLEGLKKLQQIMFLATMGTQTHGLKNLS